MLQSTLDFLQQQVGQGSVLTLWRRIERAIAVNDIDGVDHLLDHVNQLESEGWSVLNNWLDRFRPELDAFEHLGPFQQSVIIREYQDVGTDLNKIARIDQKVGRLAVKLNKSQGSFSW